MMALTAVELRMAQELLDALNHAPCCLTSSPTAFILNTGTWLYVEFSEEQHQHVVVDPE